MKKVRAVIALLVILIVYNYASAQIDSSMSNLNGIDKDLNADWTEIRYRMLTMSVPLKKGSEKLQSKHKNVIINTEEEYHNFISEIFKDLTQEKIELKKFSKMEPITRWQELIPEDVDFQKFTILANYTISAGNQAKRKKVLRNDTEKVLKYVIEFRDPGFCVSGCYPIYDFNIIMVDKVPADYKTEFKAEQINEWEQ